LNRLTYSVKKSGKMPKMPMMIAEGPMYRYAVSASRRER